LPQPTAPPQAPLYVLGEKNSWQTGRVHDVKDGQPHQVDTPEYNTNVTNAMNDSPVFQLESTLLKVQG